MLILPKTDDEWRSEIRQILHSKGKSLRQATDFVAFYGYSSLNTWMKGHTKSITVAKLRIAIEALNRL